MNNQRSSTARSIRLSSTIFFPTLRAYRSAISGHASAEGQIIPGSENNYGIEGNPSLHELQEAISAREGALYTYLYPTGLAAITAVLDCFTKPGDHILMPDGVYGPTRLYCDFLAEQKSMHVDYYSATEVGSIESAITKHTKIIYIESPASVTFELTDIDHLVRVAKKHNIITVADNTWSSLTLSRPLLLGVDISITSLTKYAAGYSDVFMGSVSLRDSKLNRLINRHHNVTGAYASPFDATLVQRGLESLDTRMSQHAANALKISAFLEAIPHKKIYFHHKERGIDPQFDKYYSGVNGLLSIELLRPYTDDELEAFLEPLKIFRLGESWGGTHSLVLFFQPKDLLQRKVAPHNTVIRIHSGLEPIDEQITDLELGFSKLFKHVVPGKSKSA